MLETLKKVASFDVRLDYKNCYFHSTFLFRGVICSFGYFIIRICLLIFSFFPKVQKKKKKSMNILYNQMHKRENTMKKKINITNANVALVTLSKSRIKTCKWRQKSKRKRKETINRFMESAWSRRWLKHGARICWDSFENVCWEYGL